MMGQGQSGAHQSRHKATPETFFMNNIHIVVAFALTAALAKPQALQMTQTIIGGHAEAAYDHVTLPAGSSSGRADAYWVDPTDPNIDSSASIVVRQSGPLSGSVVSNIQSYVWWAQSTTSAIVRLDIAPPGQWTEVELRLNGYVGRWNDFWVDIDSDGHLEASHLSGTLTNELIYFTVAPEGGSVTLTFRQEEHNTNIDYSLNVSGNAVFTQGQPRCGAALYAALINTSGDLYLRAVGVGAAQVSAILIGARTSPFRIPGGNCWLDFLPIFAFPASSSAPAMPARANLWLSTAPITILAQYVMFDPAQGPVGAWISSNSVRVHKNN